MRSASVSFFLLVLVLPFEYAVASQPEPVRYTENREACADRNLNGNLYFGDLHVHTSFSWDAWQRGLRLEPADAYRFARGEAVMLGERSVQLSRPLDFAAVTDHSEFLGETQICGDPRSSAYGSPYCRIFRHPTIGVVGVALSALPIPFRPPACFTDGRACRDASQDTWIRTQQAAEDYYDRTDCRFTTFVGYEYTAATYGQTLHRNVLFRNDQVPAAPTSYFEAPKPNQLWKRLKNECIDAGTGCEVIAIPHNSNQSGGGMFGATGRFLLRDERAYEDAKLRSEIERLMEIYQTKGASECNDLFSADELCKFELLPIKPCRKDGEGLGIVCADRMDYVREVLAAGLVEFERLGVNPYELGVIASTDTHNATPGLVEESEFIGHKRLEQIDPLERLQTPYFGSGGLAAVWSVENSRDALFEALYRRETYATSGPRIPVRFFGGWDFGSSACEDSDMIENAYESGVPMGGRLPETSAVETAQPKFLVWATQDQTPLERVQIVKVWPDEDRERRESVIDVAVAVDEASGQAELCAVWEDSEFDPSRPAAYYARVLQIPTPRWSDIACDELGDEEVKPLICAARFEGRERAWTSAIWYGL
ncbi:MAG: DUF3604 domain-containing protein [Pseudomonadota bacterium]|nr:DUF3604 domain-containing protein [Pseudomonadota bacterium]